MLLQVVRIAVQPAAVFEELQEDEPVNQSLRKLAIVRRGESLHIFLNELNGFTNGDKKVIMPATRRALFLFGCHVQCRRGGTLKILTSGTGDKVTVGS